MGVDLDKWTEKVRGCEYLAEDELKALCEYVSKPRWSCLLAPALLATCLPAWGPSREADLLVIFIQVKEILVEESNVQPVNSPVTVRMCKCTARCLKRASISQLFYGGHQLAQGGNATV